MGHLSIVAIRVSQLDSVRDSTEFGNALATAIRLHSMSRDSMPVQLDGNLVGSVLRTAHADDDVPVTFRANQQLVLAWVWHDHMDVIASDAFFGAAFTREFRTHVERLDGKVDVHVHANDDRCSATGAVIFYQLNQGETAHLRMYGNRVDMTK